MRWHGGPILSGVADHHHRIPDSHFGMHDGTVGHVIASQFTSPESLLEEIDDFLGAYSNKVR
jgi:hypothetical protein